jgi:hypothetical protein
VLSENRAQTIVDYMIDRGVSRDRIQTVKGVAWEGGNDVDAEGNVIDLGPLENNPIRRRTVVIGGVADVACRGQRLEFRLGGIRDVQRLDEVARASGPMRWPRVSALSFS